MKINTPKLLLYSAILILVLMSFHYKKHPVSFMNSKNSYMRNFIHIPSGSLYIATDSVYHIQQTKGIERFYITKAIPSFYISATEVSNEQYKEFLQDLWDTKRFEEYKIAQVDSVKWEATRTIYYSEPYVTYYFSHPAYNNYPCVCVSYEGAMLYCKWLAEKIRAAHPDWQVEARLPTADECMYAAQGKDKKAVYTWEGESLVDKKQREFAVFKRVYEQYITRNTDSGILQMVDDSMHNTNTYYVTAPVKSYLPNYYGLYNMCGNVAEMLITKGKARGGSWNSPGYDIRIASEENYTESTATIGFRPVLILKTDI